MQSPRPFSFKSLRLGVLGIFATCTACNGSSHHAQSNDTPSGAIDAQAQTVAPLSADDVSWLFPAPTHAEDFAKLIAVRDLSTPNPQDATKRDPVWPDAVFQQFLDIAASPAAQVAGTPARIGLPTEVQSIDAWFIAGIRIDAGAPGLASDIRAQYGQLPQIRLIIQPVTRNADGTPHVHDIAGHLIFDFITALDPSPQTGCRPRPVPDAEAFHSIVADLAALRTKLSNGQLGDHKISTSGVPLGVHPGLADPTTATTVRQEMKSFLERHISSQRLDAMAIAGLPSGAAAPWIFLSILGVRPGEVAGLPNGGFIPVNGPTLDGQQFAEMLQPAGTAPRVVPEPHTNNLNPITCKNAALSPTILPIAERKGVSTSTLFATPPPSADQAKQIIDVIADPTKSFFFNTDCISCHTETRRAMDLLKVTDIPGIDPAALPNGQWDIRNFGWSPSGKGVQATVTRRTAAETAAVVASVNSQQLLRK
jgi:hypothetical protein